MSETIWQNRWKITVKLTTTSPLHIGGDLPRERDIYPMADKTKRKKETVAITSVVTDGKGKPYLPGSTIKGNLRSWMKERDPAFIKDIFGSEHSENKDQFGGKIEFCDAFWDKTLPSFTENPPYWEEDRLTGITASVAIDRETGTASNKKLFHLEYVPLGVSFTLQITGQDMSDDEVSSLLYALSHGFDDQNQPITLGASTANGWGRFDCEVVSVEKLDAEKVHEWLKDPEAVGYAIPMTTITQWRTLMEPPPPGTKTNLLKIGLELKFDGPFIVNDQSKSKKVRGDEHDADMNPRCGTDGKVILPAESFRGAIRSQAERIIRTIDGKACTPKKPCKAIRHKGEETNLCLVCQLFGASGWKTLVDVPQFTLKGNSATPFTQDFVAIDRFTGGTKEGAKFKTISILDPVFTGTLTVDLNRGVEPWVLGLLALTLRDLCEGDITFGFGAAKGYGTCMATISSTAGHEDFSALSAWEKLGKNVIALEKKISDGGASHG